MWLVAGRVETVARELDAVEPSRCALPPAIRGKVTPSPSLNVRVSLPTWTVTDERLVRLDAEDPNRLQVRRRRRRPA